MNIEEELMKRYLYLYENKELILAMCIELQSRDKEIKEKIKDIKRLKRNTSDKDIIDLYDYYFSKLKSSLGKKEYYLLKDVSNDIVDCFEDFLLSDKQIEGTDLYRHIEAVKSNIYYYEMFNNMIIGLKERRKQVPLLKSSSPFTVWKILNYVRRNSTPNGNRVIALDKYFNIDRYVNTGVNWESGYYLNPSEVEEKKEELSLYPGLSFYSSNNYIGLNYLNNNLEEEDNYFDISYYDKKITNSSRMCSTKFIFNLVNMPNVSIDTKERIYESLHNSYLLKK